MTGEKVEMYADLKEYLHALKAQGKLHRIDAEVDKDWELSAEN